MSNDYAYWQAKLRGEDPDPLADRTVMPCGFFRTSHNEPLACWLDDSGERIATISGHPMTRSRMERVAEVGGFGKAITEDAYRFRMKNGHFPDDPPLHEPGIGHNLSGDALVDIKAELDSEVETTTAFLAKPIETQEDADRCGTWSRRVGQLAKRADEAHDVEKEPHLVAGRAVDDRWRPIREGATGLTRKLKDHLETYLKAQRRKQEEAARAAAAEAERLRREAATATEEQRTALNREAAAHEKKAAAPISTTAGRTGFKVALKTETRARIVDYNKALKAVKDNAEIKELVQTLANRAAKAGIPLAGTEIEKVEAVR